jgi:drug/metabolite transporter (DMT)-like permease
LAAFGQPQTSNVKDDPPAMGHHFAYGIFGYYLSSLFDFIGLQYISAGLERLILFLYPTFAVLINLFFSGKSS